MFERFFLCYNQCMAELGSKKEKSAEEEIRELERLLAEKKQVLAEKGVEKEPKEVFKEVFKEYVETRPASAPASSAMPQESQAQQKPTVGLDKKQREEQLKVLIELSFEKGIAEAVSLAEAMTPWILDEFHDKLVDEYYDKLVQSQNLREL